jgi:hypothetical protein
MCDVPEGQGTRTRKALANQCLNDLYVSPCTLDMSAQNPVVMISRLFNALPAKVKMTEEDQEFKCKIRQLALIHQFYDFDEILIGIIVN